MRSWRYLLLALPTAGGLAPLGLALTLGRLQAGRVLTACLGALGLLGLLFSLF